MISKRVLFSVSGDDPLDRAGVIGAPDVDQLVGALRLLEVIGEIGAEIGPRAVRLLDRAILIVTELGRAEQRQLDRLPIVGHFALGGIEHAVIDQIARAQPFLGRLGLAACSSASDANTA